MSKIRFCTALLVFAALACGPTDTPMEPTALASDADLAQYNRPAANAEAANVADALLSALLVVRDGKGITADSNGTGSAPVNRSIKQIADEVAGIRCALLGNCASVNQRTVKSLQADGTGGAISAAAAGNILASGTMAAATARGGTSTPTTANPHGVITKDSAPLGFGTYSWSGSAYALVGGFNVYSIAQISTGIVDVTYASAPANYLKCAGSANSNFNGGAAFSIEVTATGITGARLIVRYTMRNSAGSLADTGFTSLMFCGG